MDPSVFESISDDESMAVDKIFKDFLKGTSPNDEMMEVDNSFEYLVEGTGKDTPTRRRYSLTKSPTKSPIEDPSMQSDGMEDTDPDPEIGEDSESTSSESSSSDHESTTGPDTTTAKDSGPTGQLEFLKKAHWDWVPSDELVGHIRSMRPETKKKYSLSNLAYAQFCMWIWRDDYLYIGRKLVYGQFLEVWYKPDGKRAALYHFPFAKGDKRKLTGTKPLENMGLWYHFLSKLFDFKSCRAKEIENYLSYLYIIVKQFPAIQYYQGGETTYVPPPPRRPWSLDFWKWELDNVPGIQLPEGMEARVRGYVDSPDEDHLHAKKVEYLNREINKLPLKWQKAVRGPILEDSPTARFLALTWEERAREQEDQGTDFILPGMGKYVDEMIERERSKG